MKKTNLPLIRLLSVFIAGVHFLTPQTAYANLEWLCKHVKMDACDKRQFSRSSSASIPSESSSYRLNPSSIPTDKGFGGEIITANGNYDFGFVTGTGKIGAAISPTSMEDTFFSNLPIEETVDYQERKRGGRAYKSNKYTFAASTELNRSKGRKTFRPALGIIAKYNTKSKVYSTGMGMSLGLGPVTFGYAFNKDDYYNDEYVPASHIRYLTKTLTLGFKLPYLAIDYSRVENVLSEVEDTRIIILSATLFWKQFMFTYGTREELSFRPYYDRDLDTFLTQEIKNEGFLGIQYSFKKRYLVGLFNNYFMNEEWSIGLTTFF